MISRRELLRSALALGLGVLFPSKLLYGENSFPHFFFTQIRYRGGAWDPNPHFVEAMVEELELRTSIDGARERRVTDLSDRDLFFAPFLFMAGKYEFEPFSAQERKILRRYLTFGGFLLAEDTLGVKGYGFDRAFREEMKRIFPEQDLKHMPLDHPVYQSFYLINQVGGRQPVSPYFEGIILDQWTPVIYSQNDLSGAWSRDQLGKWVHECTPGGEGQRSLAFKAGINVIVYSLTSDYKRDLVHHPFIKKRLNP
jgi:hypothetical protein